MSVNAPEGSISLHHTNEFEKMEAEILLNVDGTIRDKPTKGSLRGDMTTNGPNHRIEVKGSLLKPIVAEFGSPAMAALTPKAVDLYKVPGTAYIVVNTLFAMCVEPDAPKIVDTLEEMSPASLLEMFTNSDVAKGRLAGETTKNGRPVIHYIIDGKEFTEAARNSSNKQLKAFGEGLVSAEDANLYVDKAGDYPVAFDGAYHGAFEPLRFKGNFDVAIEILDVNDAKEVELPNSCSNPISW